MSEIEKQVSVLWDLKKVADQIHHIKADLVKIPEDIKKLQANLEQAKSAFDGEKAKMSALEKRGRDAERDAKIEDDFLKKTEAKMKDVTNSHTLQAATKEAQDRKKIKAGYEETAMKAMTELETKKGAFDGYQAQYLEVEKKTVEECAALEASLANLKAEISKLESLQMDLTKGLTPRISTIYLRLSRGGKGIPIAQVNEGACLNCHMKVRPQLYNEVIGFKEIHQCSGCQKLLVHTPAEKAAPLDA